MASPIFVHSLTRKLFRLLKSFRYGSPLFVLSFFLYWLLAPAASAQFQSAFVFASDPKGVAVYTRNDATGVLTPVSGSPYPSKEAVTFLALDLKARYLPKVGSGAKCCSHRDRSSTRSWPKSADASPRR